MYNTYTYLPPHLPAMSSFFESNPASCTVRALSNGIPVHRESIGFNVNVSRTVPRIPRMMKGAQLGFVWGAAH